jgi:hypothetical protein
VKFLRYVCNACMFKLSENISAEIVEIVALDDNIRTVETFR